MLRSNGRFTQVVVGIASLFLVATPSLAQQKQTGLLPLAPNSAKSPGDAKRQEEERLAETDKQRTAAPIELKTFFQQIVGTKENEVVQESEIEDILNRFEYQYRVLIPDRDVLLTSSLTTKQLIEALRSRIERTTDGDNNLPDSAIPINGGSKENWESVKPFQRRDILNSPNKMLRDALRVPGLQGGAGDFYNSDGSLNVAVGAGYPKVTAEDVVGRAMLDIRPDIGDPVTGDALSRIRTSNAPITSSEYNLIKAQFMQMPSTNSYKALALPERDLAVGTSPTDRFDDDWFKLRIAMIRRFQEKATQNYSNGRSRFDTRGREVYPNGRPKSDDAGRPLYSNGRRKFDEGGRSVHSNGIPKYNTSGTPLYANGQAKKSDSGRNLFRGGERKSNERGVPLYENGQARVAQSSSQGSVRERLSTQEAGSKVVDQIGVPVSPTGQRMIDSEDGRTLYENGRPKVNDSGDPLFKNQQQRVALNGQEQFDNARRMDNSRGQALTFDSEKIAGTFGFQGRPSGVFPLACIQWASFVKATADEITVRLEKEHEERSFPLEGAFVGCPNQETPTAIAARVPIGSRVRLIWTEPTKFVDGLNVGLAGEPKLLALLTTSTSAAQKPGQADIPTIRMFSGTIEAVAEDTLSVKEKSTGAAKEFRLGDAAVQRSSAGKTAPVAARSLAIGRAVTIIGRTTVTYKDGKVVSSTPVEAIAIWQDGP